MKPPYEAVREEFEFPFELRPFQIARTNTNAQWDRTGIYWDPGLGKTSGSTHWALHWSLVSGIEQWICLMPPILVLQWQRWVQSVRYRGGRALTATAYLGTPAQRKNLDLDADFILMSYGILKKDMEHLIKAFEGRPYGVIADEAQAIKNMDTDNYKAVRDLSANRPLALLTGTPTTSPWDAYTYIKLVAPAVYRNKRAFSTLHVGDQDGYGNVTQWQNLDTLNTNMQVQTTRAIKREVMSELPAVTYTTIPYELAPGHMKLYRRIAEERLVEFEDGREIDAISRQALEMALQQVIMNWSEFEGDPMKEPAALEIIEGVLDEIGGDGKLAVVANFQKTNRYLLDKLAKHGVVAIYGEISPREKQSALREFVENPGCRCILLHPASAGLGIDGLQHVCSDMLIVEAPTTAPVFHQVVSRLDRDGQRNPVNCRVAVANGTVQVRMFKRLLSNDELVNRVQGGYQDLREVIYGT